MPLTIYTEGTKGVDTHVEHLCHKCGHQCVVFIPPCQTRAKSLVPLTKPDLDAAMPIVPQAAFHLGRHVSHPISLQYLQRNYHVIKPASLVLALGYFDELRKHVLSGTGWKVATAQILLKPLYVFDLHADLHCPSLARTYSKFYPILLRKLLLYKQLNVQTGQEHLLSAIKNDPICLYKSVLLEL